MRIIDLALKDISQIGRDRKSLLFLIAMPIIFTLFMGVAFRGAAAPEDPRLAVGWVNGDTDGRVTEALKSALDELDAIRLVPFKPGEAEEANRQVAAGKLAAALVIPAGFSDQVLAGNPAQIALVADEYSSGGQSALQVARIPVTRIMSAVETARLVTDGIAAAKPFASRADQQAELNQAFAAGASSWQEMAASGPRIVLVKAAGETGEKAPLGGNPYNQTSPGILVQFAIFSLVTSATILVQERKTRTLERLLTTSMTRAEIIAGHLLAMFLVIFLQQAMLVAFGQFVLKVDYLREPLGTLAVMAALGLWVATMGLFIGVFSKGEDQVVLFSLIFMFLFSALGGAWFPLEGAGPAFNAIGHFTPAAWAMDGFQNLLVRGLAGASVLLPAIVLLGYAVFFFGAALWKFRIAE